MSLRSERTKWVMFLPCSKEEVEPRHVFDIVFGVLCLEKAGINPQDISIYIDSPNRNLDGFFFISLEVSLYVESISRIF